MPRRMAVFMSDGTGLADWRAQGILDREVALYRALDREAGVRSVLIVPDVRPAAAQEATVPGVDVCWSPCRVPRRLYPILAPLYHWRALRACALFRTHNGRGVWGAVLASLIHRKPLVARFGYVWSWDAARRGVAGWKLWGILLGEWLACRIARTIIVGTPAQAGYLRTVHGVN